MLGMLYLTGLRVPRDQAQAMMWFSRSVAQCNQYVQFSIEHQNTLRLVPVMLTVTRLPYHTSRFFKAHSLPRSSTDLHIDRKRRQKLQAKRIALDHKADDHEEAQSQCGMVIGRM